MNMNAKEKLVSTIETLIAAAKDNNAQDIVVYGNLMNVPSINLMPGHNHCGAKAPVPASPSPKARTAFGFHPITVSQHPPRRLCGKARDFQRHFRGEPWADRVARCHGHL
jgi:hypothetical protein